jgi:hypothetical protein
MARTYPPFEFGPTGNETQARFKDYEEVGKKLIAWAQGGPATWPKNIDELRTAMQGHLTIPSQVKHLIVMQSDDSIAEDTVFILRLPAKGQVTESDQLAAQGQYDVPPVVKMLHNKVDEGGAAIGTTQRLFHARVADYTMRQCR